MKKAKWVNKKDEKLWRKMNNRYLQWLKTKDKEIDKVTQSYYNDMEDWINKYEQLQKEKNEIVHKYETLLSFENL